MVKKRAIGGKERRKKVRYVRRQDGSCGWRTAQERFTVRAWAGETIGDIAVSEAGSWAFLLGKRMGDMKGGHFRREISASESTISYVPGQGRFAG